MHHGLLPAFCTLLCMQNALPYMALARLAMLAPFHARVWAIAGYRYALLRALALHMATVLVRTLMLANQLRDYHPWLDVTRMNRTVSKEAGASGTAAAAVAGGKAKCE